MKPFKSWVRKLTWQTHMCLTPAFIEPMLAKLVETLPEGPEWEYELKLDGYRLEAIKNGDKARLYSRRGNDFTKKFARIAASVSKIRARSAVSRPCAPCASQLGMIH